MNITAKSRLHVLMQNGVFVALLIALTALIAYFAYENRIERDVTQNRRNTLSQPAREVLGKLHRGQLLAGDRAGDGRDRGRVLGQVGARVPAQDGERQP